MITYPPETIASQVVRLLARPEIVLVDTERWVQLKSGIHSPVYFQLRALPETRVWHEVVLRMAEFYSWLRKTNKVGAVQGFFGVPEGARDIAAAMAYSLSLRPVRIDARTKGHGLEKHLIGASAGMRVAVIEDVGTSGTSIMEKGVLPLRAHNVSVVFAMMIATHDIGVDEALQQAGVTAFALCRSRDVIVELFRAHPQRYPLPVQAAVHAWFKDPAAASERYNASLRAPA